MNNYNMSNTGINIETYIYLNNEQSGWNFQDNFIQIKAGIFKGKWIYTDWGNLFYTAKKHNIDLEYFGDDIQVKPNATARKEMIRTAMSEWYYPDYKELQSMTTQELFEEFNNGYSDTKEVLDRFDLEVLNLDYIETSTMGYCQGDYEEVIIPTKLLRECWGTKEDIKDDELISSDYIDNLFWDSPMSVMVRINDVDYSVEKFDGQYQQWGILSYDKEEVINDIIEQVRDGQPSINLEVLKSELEYLVPDQIEY